ncbi:MAG: hypothetical protein PW792_02010 [Acidobacteriaceae bacterium]|nr:hypothetical protein [Acidobacteriaceae bacterium]
MTPATELSTTAYDLPATPPEPTKHEVWEECERIAQSDEFRTAMSQQRLLRFLVKETLEDRGGNLKEYSVGLEVFQRTQDFDPRTDAIVRVTVGQLRRRLTAYYNGIGVNDPVVIQIPRGHYSAEFSYPLLPEPAPAVEVATEKEEATSSPSHITAPASTWASARAWVTPCLVLLALLIGAAGGWMIRRAQTVRPAEASVSSSLRQSVLWSNFLHGETHAIGMVGIASSAAIGPAIVRLPNLNDDASIRNDQTIQKLSTMFGKPAYAYNVYTGIGEALAVGQLAKTFSASSLNLSIMASHDARWQDLHADNVIFISSLRFRDLHSELERPLDFTTAPDADGGLRILNRSPRNGEQAAYNPSGNYVGPSVDYALVSVIPGTVPNRSIMSVGGIGTLGTAGAMQFILERQSLAELDAKLKQEAAPRKGRSSLQILLKVDIVDNQVVSVHYVTHHWIPAQP